MNENNQDAANDTQDQMSFWDHLDALRWVLVRTVIVLIIFAIAVFSLMPWIFDHIILAPTQSGFFLYTWMCELSRYVAFMPEFCDQQFKVEMVNLELTAQFFRHLSTSCWIALVLICPYLLFELWGFIRPALYIHEQKNVRWAFLLGTVMFFIGCTIGYSVIFPMTLRFLYTYSLSDVIHNQLSLESYLDNFVMLILAMGLVFELPLLSWLLSQIGILHKSFFRKYRRHAIVALLIAAALITPTGDPFTLFLVFFPLYGLYELSILFVKADEAE
ncbi:MAG: twin-arginine translocase subunit TatC [Dysgonamonadaceae bacterium]|jgi:sec-independent protein translocase protein TatC|nr:twin-arginine translocase subunit TatC [Dysgonamonadaceae bacterium]